MLFNNHLWNQNKWKSRIKITFRCTGQKYGFRKYGAKMTPSSSSCLEWNVTLIHFIMSMTSSFRAPSAGSLPSRQRGRKSRTRLRGCRNRTSDARTLGWRINKYVKLSWKWTHFKELFYAIKGKLKVSFQCQRSSCKDPVIGNIKHG